MTPLEIADHKRRWMSSGDNNPVNIHSDLREQAKDYCKTKMDQSQWIHRKHTDVFEDTFFFELEENAEAFRSEFEHDYYENFDEEWEEDEY